MPKGYTRNAVGQLVPSGRKGRMPFKLNSIITSKQLVSGKVVEMIAWTCPHCGHRNSQRWFGRERHVCLNCDEWTELKGATVTGAAVEQMEVQ